MSLEFYDPRRPAGELMADVEECLRRTTLDRDVLMTASGITVTDYAARAGSDQQVVCLYSSGIDFLTYDYDPALRRSGKRRLREFRAFIAEVAEHAHPLFAGHYDNGGLPTLSAVRAGPFAVEDLWIGPELAEPVSRLDLQVLQMSSLVGGTWVSFTENALRGNAVSHLDDEQRFRDFLDLVAEDEAAVREALLAGLGDLVPLVDVVPKQANGFLYDGPTFHGVALRFWRRGSSAEQLYADLGVAMLGRGAVPLGPSSWAGVPTVVGPGQAAVELEHTGVVTFMTECYADEQDLAVGVRDVVFGWLADVAQDVQASVAAMDEGPMGWPPFQDAFLMPDRIAVRREPFGTAAQRWKELMPEARSWTRGDLLLWDCSRVRGEDAYDRQTLAGELLKKRLHAQ